MPYSYNYSEPIEMLKTMIGKGIYSNQSKLIIELLDMIEINIIALEKSGNKVVAEDLSCKIDTILEMPRIKFYTSIRILREIAARCRT